jgi:hypothetical protein
MRRPLSWRILKAKVDPSAKVIFDSVYSSFCSDSNPRGRVVRWASAINSGAGVEAWDHRLGCLLIEIGAEQRGLRRAVATPHGAGRRKFHQAEAASTQRVIAAFRLFLEGGDPISIADWNWLKALFETFAPAMGAMGRRFGTRGRPT